MKKTYYKPVAISVAVIILNIAFGFDWKFTIINLIWLLPFDRIHEKDPRSVHRQ